MSEHMNLNVLLQERRLEFAERMLLTLEGSYSRIPRTLSVQIWGTRSGAGRGEG